MAFVAEEKGFNGTISDDLLNNLYDSENVMDDWLLAGSPLPVLISLSYFVVIKLGVRWMENKPAYDLSQVLRVYNVFQIAMNLYLFFGFLQNLEQMIGVMKNTCAVDLQGKDQAKLRYEFLYYFWGYLVSKIIDLLDTIFMVLRKKNSHISFLHVYHHGGMVFFTWVTLRYAKAHQAALPGLLNVAVHVVMYTYYFLATFGPSMEKYLWWKQHLTKLQLSQFAVILVYLCGLYYNDCPVPKIFYYIWIFNVIVVFSLFINFYIKTYILKINSNKEKMS